MRVLNTSFLALTSSLALLSACSLVNKFDELDDSSEASGGMGGEDATGGDDGMGGASGGGESTGGTDGSGGANGPDPVAPGLVIFGADGDQNNVTRDDRFILALDPLTGEEYTRLEEDFVSVAYEAERDIWFLVKEDSMQAARFNRVSLEFEKLGKPVDVEKAVQSDLVFALGETVSIVTRGAELGTLTIQVYNTSSLDGMLPLREIPLPSNPAAGELKSLWGMTSAHLSSGNSLYATWSHCMEPPALPACRVMAARIQPENGTVTPREVVAVPQATPNMLSSDSGAITYDIESLQPVVYVPGYAVGSTEGTLHTFTSSLVPQQQFPIKKPGDRGQLLDMNPCLKSVFAKDVSQNPLVVAPLSASPDAMGVDISVGINGQGMVYEPYSKSLLMIQVSGDARTIALESRGTVDQPAMMKRLATWKPPQFNPTFVTVEQPIDPVCD